MRHPLTIALLITAACGDGPSSPGEALPIVDGVWHASWSSASGAIIGATLEVSQADSRISGVAYVGGPRYPITGAVAADSLVTINFYADGVAFTFEGRVSSAVRLEGRILGYDTQPVDAVFTREEDSSGPSLRAAGVWTSSWIDETGSWSMVLTFEQLFEQLFVSGSVMRTSTPQLELAVGGGTGPANGSVGQFGGVRLQPMVHDPTTPFVMTFLGRFSSSTTIEGELSDFPVEGASRSIVLRK
jgi:hypothetical protein